MTPTLQDVSYLLGLPLQGQPIGPLHSPDNWDGDMAARFLGINPVAQPFASEGHGPKLDWLLDFQVCSTVFFLTFDMHCLLILTLGSM